MYWTLAACIGFGIYYWLLGFAVTPILGGITPNWLIHLVPLCLLAPFSTMTRQNLRIPRGSIKIAFRLPNEAGAHAQLAHAVVNKIDS
jgi:hypothetical protein